MALAEVNELAAYLSAEFDGALSAQAQLLLDIATAEIQGYTGQLLEYVEDDEITIDAPVGSDMPAFLPELPVIGVSAVELDGIAAEDFTFYTHGLLYRTNAAWWSDASTARQKLVVTYSHGYEDIPADLKGVCLSLAGRLLEGKSGFTVDTEGNPANASTTTRAGAIGTFTDEERAVMDRYRILAVA